MFSNRAEKSSKEKHALARAEFGTDGPPRLLILP